MQTRLRLLLVSIILLLATFETLYASSWKGHWTQKGTTFDYSFEMHLDDSDEDKVRGIMKWTVLSANNKSTKSRAYFKNRLGKSALVFVEGHYSAKEKKYILYNKGEDDPFEIVGVATYHLFVKGESLKGKSLVGREKYRDAKTQIVGERASFSSYSILKSMGIDLKQLSVDNLDVGDTDRDGRIYFGESGYFSYRVKNPSKTWKLPMWLRIDLVGKGAKINIYGELYHYFFRQVDPEDDSGLLLFRYQRDSTLSTDDDLQLALQITFLDDFSFTLAEKSIPVENQMWELTHFPATPNVALKQLPGLYLDSKKNRLLNFRKDSTFSLRLTDGSLVTGNWHISGGIREFFEDNKLPTISERFNSIAFSNYRAYQGTDKWELFKDAKLKRRLFGTSVFAKKGSITIRGDKGRYGYNYYTFFRVGSINRKDPLAKKLEERLIGGWKHFDTYRVHHYKLLESHRVMYANSKNPGTDVGRWLVCSDIDEAGNKMYYLLLYQFKVKEPIKYALSIDYFKGDQLMLGLDLSVALTELEEKSKENWVRDESFDFSNEQMQKERYFNPFNDFFNAIILDGKTTEGKNCSRCGGAGSTRADMGTCWACHGTGKE